MKGTWFGIMITCGERKDVARTAPGSQPRWIMRKWYESVAYVVKSGTIKIFVLTVDQIPPTISCLLFVFCICIFIDNVFVFVLVFVFLLVMYLYYPLLNQLVMSLSLCEIVFMTH